MSEITDEMYLRCPCCWFETWVSPEDPDASLSDMHRHLRACRPDRDPNKLLAKVIEVTR